MSHSGMTQEQRKQYSFKMAQAFLEVDVEMNRQVSKWGVQEHSSYVNIDIIGHLETVADLDINGSLTDHAKLLCDKRMGMGLLSWQDILNEEVLEARDEAIAGNYEALKVELIQVAAVALSWYLSVERNGR